MFHRIPRAILQSLPCGKNIRLLDPFCGSGTVLLEGMLLGHKAIGIDVNPLARLISLVKTTPIDPGHLQRHYSGIIRRARQASRVFSADPELDYWFRRPVRDSLRRILYSIQQIQDPECCDFFTVCLSACVRPCSWADPSIAPPVRLNKTRVEHANARYLRDFKRASSISGEEVFYTFEKVVNANLRRMRELFEDEGLGNTCIQPARFEASNTGVSDNAIDAVVTSPPYCGAQKYARSLRLEMLILGFTNEEIADVDRRTLGTERVRKADVEQEVVHQCPLVGRLVRKIRKRNPVRAHMLSRYVSYLESFASEVARVLKPGSNAFVTFGTDHLAGIRIDSGDLFARAASRYSLVHVATMIDTIPSRGMITVRHSTARTIPDERVIWVRKG